MEDICDTGPTWDDWDVVYTGSELPFEEYRLYQWGDEEPLVLTMPKSLERYGPTQFDKYRIQYLDELDIDRNEVRFLREPFPGEPGYITPEQPKITLQQFIDSWWETYDPKE